MINGQLVIRKGTAAIGSVINAEKRGYMGKSGKLAIQVEIKKLKFIGADKVKAPAKVIELSPNAENK